MSRLVIKCPKCEHKETVISSRPGADLPPCPRCEDFVRMENHTPAQDQSQVAWSTGGARAAAPSAETADGNPTVETKPIPPKRRDPRDYGPEPRA